MRQRDGEERIVLVERGGSGFGWFVIGAALGAGLGLLFAPASGRDTRKKIGRGLEDLKERAEEQIDELAEGLQEGKERIRAKIERWVEPDHEDAAEAEPASAREELERRLSQARSRRRRPEAEDEEPVA